jgi:hypothetical protein
MLVIAVFIGFVFIGDAISVGLAAMIEPYSQFWSLLVFLGLFVGVFAIAWKSAVYVTERFLIRAS